MRGTSKSSLILAACAALTAGQVMGANGTWKGGATEIPADPPTPAIPANSWLNPGNWNGGTIPGDKIGATSENQDTATFNAIGKDYLEVGIDSDRTVKILSFSGVSGYVIGSTTGPALTLVTKKGDAGSFNNGINVAGSISATIDAPLIWAYERAIQVGADGLLTLNGDQTLMGSSGVMEHGSDFNMTFRNSGGTTVIHGVISGTGGIYINGGTPNIILTGANTYSNNTNMVAPGSLWVNNTSGSGTGSGSVSISANGLLGGSGFVVTNDKIVVVSGMLSPGSAPGEIGTLTINAGTGGMNLSNATAAEGGQKLLFDLDTVANSDRVELLGTTVLKIGTGTLDLDDFVFTTTSNFGAGIYTLFSSLAPINGSLGSNLTGTVGGLDATLGFGDVGQHSIVLTVVPEPGTMGVLVIGALGLLVRRRRGIL